MVPKTVPLIPAALPSSVSTCIAGANFSLTLITTSLKVNDLPSGDSILTETTSPFFTPYSSAEAGSRRRNL